MNIDLLSKMVKDLILDNDRVCLPGLGSFVAESVPASFSDDGYAIRPPYRKLYFRRNVSEDALLTEAYSRVFGVSAGNAEAELREFILEMKAVLDRQKVIIFPGLGKLRATQENNYFFVTDDDIDICPEYNRLETLPLKVRKEPGTVIGKYVFAEPQPESQPEPQPESQPEPQPEPRKKRLGKGIRVAIWTVAAVAAVFAAFVLVSRLMPGSTDFLLYSSEEMEILRAAGL